MRLRYRCSCGAEIDLEYDFHPRYREGIETLLKRWNKRHDRCRKLLGNTYRVDFEIPGEAMLSDPVPGVMKIRANNAADAIVQVKHSIKDVPPDCVWITNIEPCFIGENHE